LIAQRVNAVRGKQSKHRGPEEFQEFSSLVMFALQGKQRSKERRNPEVRQARTYTPRSHWKPRKVVGSTIDKIARGQTFVGRLFEREKSPPAKMIDHTFSFYLDGLITLSLPQASFPQFLVKKGTPLSVSCLTQLFFNREVR
jgi:hypothetical protein